MTKQELWEFITNKNPSFLKMDSNVTLKARGLKKLFDTAYDEGFSEAVTEITQGRKDSHEGTAVDDLMRMFGMKKKK